MYAYANPVCVIVGPPIGLPGVSIDITRRISGLTFSNVDPGGFEIASITMATLPRGVRPNAEVRVMFGTEIAWHGRVNAIGESDSGTHSTFTVDCVGYGAVLTDCELSFIYIDRDLSRWQAPSMTWQALAVALNYFQHDWSVVPDASSLLPAIMTTVNDNWSSPSKPIVNVLYDAGANNQISCVHVTTNQVGSNLSAADTNWSWTMWESDTDGFTARQNSPEMRVAGAFSTYWITPTNVFQSPASGSPPSLANAVQNQTQAGRYIMLDLRYNATPAGVAGTHYDLKWVDIFTMGPSGLTLQNYASPANAGFFPGQIVQHALSQCPGAVNFTQFIDTDPLGYVVRHAAYYDQVTAQTIVDDMAKTQAWHWGVWEPAPGSAQPSIYFTARPANATCVVRRGSLTQLDAPKIQLDQLYSIAHVKYTDGAGTVQVMDVTIPNPFIGEAGLTSREIAVDMGVSTSAAATTYGQLLLNLNVTNARGSGSAIMPGRVDSLAGSKKPSCLLKAGRDRIRILDLPDSGPLDVVDTRRFDTFSVRRVESSLQANGTLQTRVEFDGGADLMEVLTARLASASVIAGT